MSQVTGMEAGNEKAVMNAICHLGDSKGASSTHIQRYLSSKQLMNDAPDLKSIQLGRKTVVDKEPLTKLDDGKYKIKETARRRKSRSRSRSRKPTTKRRSRSRKSSGSRRRKRSSSGRRKRSSSGRRRKRSTSKAPKRRRSRQKKTVPEDNV